MMKTKLVGSLSLICLILTILWLVFMIAGLVVAGPLETFEQVMAYTGGAGALFYVSYINAALVTVCVAMLFSAFHWYLKPTDPLWSGIAAIFVPVYAAMNLVVYLSQITVVLRLIDLQWIGGVESGTYLLLKLMIQQWPDSMMSTINNLAYAVLGIPSVIYGVLLFRVFPVLRTAAVFLILNGIACIAGFSGVVIQSPWLNKGVLVGGVLFLIALIPISLGFLNHKWPKNS